MRIRVRRSGSALLAAVAVATVGTLSGCEVSQINWANRTYTVSGSCLRLATVTLHDGQAITRDGIKIKLLKVLRGDINGDGIPDAVLLLACATVSSGGLQAATEIQVFTRNAKPLARITPPVYYAQPHGVFDPASLKIAQGKLYAGADYADSVYAVFRCDWNGHGFYTVYSSGHHN